MRIASLPAGLLAALLIAASASAQLAPRKIPSAALRGTYTAAEFPGAFINGTLVKMAPGVRIVMPDNRSVPPRRFRPARRSALNSMRADRSAWSGC